MELMPKDFLDAADDFSKQKSPLQLFEKKAEGGRIGYANGTEDSQEFKAYRKAIADGTFKGSFDDFLEYIDMMRDRDKTDMAEGGRIGYARRLSRRQRNGSRHHGPTFERNPAGITELDLRETGGFIPPVGVKEKADDIPAMLSNNEFVFTADAVRGMGDGDVNKGAQRMYDMMKRLEKWRKSIMAVSETRVRPPEFIEAAGKTFLSDLSKATGDFKSADLSKVYGPQFVAGLDPLQQRAVKDLQAGLDSFKPFLQTAAARTGPEI